MITVGLTGGLGSGKTTVAKVFQTLGIPVFYADDEAKELTNASPEIRQGLLSTFGPELYASGSLNKVLLASIIFNNPDALARVNRLIHPAVQQAFAAWAARQHSVYVVQEAAILFETGGYKNFDKMVLVTAPQELRITRVIQRSGWSREEALQRMANQWDENQKIPLADFVILNDGSQPLLPQILAIHENLIRSANS
jgi:dephospho-CoA kinase